MAELNAQMEELARIVEQVNAEMAAYGRITKQTADDKFDAEAKNKQEFIKNTFEFARKSVEVICKTIAGAFGTKTNTNNLK